MNRSGLRSLSRLAFGSAIVCAVISSTKPLHAFCLARQCDPDYAAAVSCMLDASGCSIQGAPLRRNSPCLTFAVVAGSADRLLGISDVEFAQLVGESFALWTTAACAGGSPSVAVRSAGAVTAAGSFSCLTVPESNIDVWSMSNRLPSPTVVTNSSGVVAGRTTPMFTIPDGSVFDADVELNEQFLLLHSSDPAKLRGFIRTIAAHEAGHALGLGHSLVKDALMFRSYEVTANRALTNDDVQAVCALFPPKPFQCGLPYVPPGALSQAACDTVTANSREPAGCTVGPHLGRKSRSPAGAVALTFATALILFRRRVARRDCA